MISNMDDDIRTTSFIDIFLFLLGVVLLLLLSTKYLFIIVDRLRLLGT